MPCGDCAYATENGQRPGRVAEALEAQARSYCIDALRGRSAPWPATPSRDSAIRLSRRCGALFSRTDRSSNETTAGRGCLR